MKRKLNVHGEPAEAEADGPVEAGPPGRPKPPEDGLSFADLGLDPRLLRAAAEQGYRTPTLVQQKAIPPALDGQDVLAKAKTGSGKTAAYLLPVLHAILRRKAADSTPLTAALILVPTRELASQVHREVDALAAFCAKDVSAVRLSDKVSAAVQRSLLSSLPDIVIATPSRAWANIAAGALDLARLTHLVLDEADLVLSYGYHEDLQAVARSIPHPVQTILLSATLTAEVDTLKALFCREPTLLDLVEQEPAGGDVSQYYVKCGEDEKFLLIYVIYKLRLIKGKTIIFVSDVDRCYRLKLFFEQFGLRSCVLNSELPVNSRIHVVEEFNKHVYDVIIASDEHEVLGDEDAQEATEDENRPEAPEGEVAQDGSHEAGPQPRPAAKTGTKANGKRKRGGDGDGERPAKKNRPARDKEYGVSRGIDFKNVSCVVNFDLPTSARSYTHRIGRTARAGQTGMALSFVIPPDKYRKHMATTVATAEHDDRVLGRIIRQQAKKGAQLGPYTFDMKQVDAFRYRMDDALRAVTRVAVREARTRELRQELLKSEKLRRHFEENPAELHHLRHDGELRAARTQTHLRHVPDYLLPGGTKLAGGGEGAAAGFVPLRIGDKDRSRSRRAGGGAGSRGGRGAGAGARGGARARGNGGNKGEKSSSRKMDPLKSFKARRPKRP